MTRRTALQFVVVAGITVIGSACTEVYRGCQLYVPDDKWSRARIEVVLQDPSNRNCPLSLTAAGMNQNYLARITAPYGTPALQPFGEPGVETLIFDAHFRTSGHSLGYFGVGADGREVANDQGFYYAGQAGPTTSLQQDVADTYIELSQSAGGGAARNSVYLPYTCCQVQTLVAALPRTPRGSTVTIRTWNGYTFPRYAWYLNGAQIFVKSCITCNPASPGAVYSRVMNTVGTFTWKIAISGTYTGQSRVMQFNMVVY